VKDLVNADFMAPETIQCPYPYLAAARASAPVHKLKVSPVPGRDVYLVTSYDIIAKILPDWRRFSSRFGELMTGGIGAGDPEVDAIQAQGYATIPTLLTEDPPAQRQYKTITAKAFGAGQVERMSDYITETCDTLIDGFIDKGEFDFFADFAVPLPIYVIADRIGVPRSDLSRIKAWSDIIILNIGRAQGRETMLEATRAHVEIQHYYADLIEQRRKEPRDDIISVLVQSRMKDGSPLSLEAMLSILRQLMVAGNETTTNVLATGMVHILDTPGQVDTFAAHPELLPNAVQELLRVDTPARAMWRIAAEDVTLASVDIPAGAILLLSYESANRDESRFEDADHCDFARANAEAHFAFGGGIHHCVGALMARKELATAYARLCSRLKNIEIVEEKTSLRYIESILARGIEKLHLRFEKR
jgi:cytochrome P450